MFPEAPKRATRRARSQKALTRKATFQQFRREVQRYKRMSVAELEEMEYDELQDALLMRSYEEED